jgi:4-hydroxybenzoate polyprenyltransferase
MNMAFFKRIERIDTETFIWLIYLFIIGFDLYSNYLEKKYLQKNDLKAQSEFRLINNEILFISLIIYGYFLYISWDNLQNVSKSNPRKQQLLKYEVIASVLFVLGGLITLYVSVNISNGSVDNEIVII